VIAGGMVK